MCVWGLRALWKADNDPEETRQHHSHPALAGQMLQQVCVPAAESLWLVAMHHNPTESFPLLLSRVQFPEPAKEHMVKSIKFIWMAIHCELKSL